MNKKEISDFDTFVQKYGENALVLYPEFDDIQIYAVGRSWEKAKSRFGAYEQDGHFHFIEQEL